MQEYSKELVHKCHGNGQQAYQQEQLQEQLQALESQYLGQWEIGEKSQ